MHALQEVQLAEPAAAQTVQQQPGQGRIYAIVPRDHGARGAVVEGTFLVNSFPAKILFDSGASHSFISHSFMLALHLLPEYLDMPLSVATPLGDSSTLDLICRDCMVSLDNLEFGVDLIVLSMSEFDIILGMDWLSSYHVSLDYFAKTICLRVPGQPDVVVATSQGNPFAEAFLAHIEEVMHREQSIALSETRVVSDFEDVFQDIPGLPPRREVEFCIELQPGTAPISRAPYVWPQGDEGVSITA